VLTNYNLLKVLPNLPAARLGAPDA
jgi:hypothetical protein